MFHRRLITLALCPLTAGAMLAATTVPASASVAPRAATSAAAPAAAPSGSLVTAVTGTVSGVDQTGTLTINRFVRTATGIAAVGTLSMGGLASAVPVQLPLNLGGATATTTASCPILHLDLGPLDLNLLGLAVHLNEVVLDITAVPGAGNLLGNLLCAVAHLLDNNALSGLTALLNQILSALGGLGL